MGRTATDQEGKFQLTVDVPSTGSHLVELDLAHDSFDPQLVRVTIDEGRPNPLFSKIQLLPRGVGRCRPTDEHGGIVGHFGTPGGAGADFPRKIADALTRNLVTRVQREHLPEGYLPYFEACEEAKPRTYLHGGHFARALEADVFLSGDLRPTAEGYDVYAWVSDRYGVFQSPLPSQNLAVDLDNPLAAELEVQTLTSILVAVARSYQEAGHEEECVDMTRAAEYLLGELTPEIEERRQSCRDDLGHVGLTREASP